MSASTTCRIEQAGALLDRYLAVRSQTETLCVPLAAEDFVVQSAPFASPVKWHLAHTTWFFETFVLREYEPGFRRHHEAFEVLFNSYYNTLGEPFPRPERGMLTRPTVAETFAFRAAVDERIRRFLERADARQFAAIAGLMEIGLHHERQHQELILTDVKHLLSLNPLQPAYLGADGAATESKPSPQGEPANWLDVDGGCVQIGAAEDEGFCYDNETPRHEHLLRDFQIADRLVTNAEFAEFVASGGYERPEFWLSDGWSWVQAGGGRAPTYWRRVDDAWTEFTLRGSQPLRRDAPAAHVTYYEADAFAAWAGGRLPTEAEWEQAAGLLRPSDGAVDGAVLEDQAWSPRPAKSVSAGAARQMFGDLWEWTASPYTSYPGFRAADGALGEYNGKFMCNQFVLRGGSFATARDHMRLTYRNFFPADAAWQFSGIRLARDV